MCLKKGGATARWALHECAVIAVTAFVLIASPASGQPAAGAIASGSVAAVVDGGGTDVSVAGSLGYRLNRVIGLGVDLTWMKLKTTTPASTTFPDSRVLYSDASADAMFFTTNVRIEIPTTSRRILPYAVGGGGTASLLNRYTVTTRISFPTVPVSTLPGVVVPIPAPPPQEISQPVSSSSTALALNLGGGVSLLATDHLSIDVDLRSFYIRGNPSGSIGRFGIGASYRF